MLKNLKIPIILLSLVFLAGFLAATLALAAEAPKRATASPWRGCCKTPRVKASKKWKWKCW